MPRRDAVEKEALVLTMLKNKCRGLTFKGKRRFASENVQISTDESFEYDGVTYLLEVDSGNIAKLLVGQYVLLNALHELSAESAFFMVVHTYEGYNIQRTLKNLQLVNQKLFQGRGIRFGMLHLNQLRSWTGGNVHQLIQLLSVPRNTL